MIRKIIHRPQAVLGLAMMLLVFLVMLLAPVFAPNDPMQLNVAHSFAPPDAQYPLGTDELGRCILSRLIYGARASLSIALPTLLLLAVISTVVATLCAYVGGALDRVLKWSLIFLWPFLHSSLPSRWWDSLSQKRPASSCLL